MSEVALDDYWTRDSVTFSPDPSPEEVKDELHRRLASHLLRPEVKDEMEARNHFHCRNSMSGLKWTPRANVDIKQTDFQHAEALLDPAYPEHVENLLTQAPFYYYVTSFLDVAREDDSRHVSTVFEFLDPVCLCGFRIRGENYSTMTHMPKCVKLFCTNDIDYGLKGDWWTEVVCVEAKMQRGWQMFVSQDVLVADAQRLSDSANDVFIRGPPKHDMPEWQAIEGSACFQLHNNVDFNSVPWTLSAPAKYYRLDVVDINGGYIALAEINFLEVARTVLQISARQSLLDKAAYSLEFSLLSGDLDCALDMDISAKVSDMLLSFKERTSLQTPAAACLVLPCGALLDQHSSNMSLYDIFGSTLAEVQ